jgi:hypothetical protein
MYVYLYIQLDCNNKQTFCPHIALSDWSVFTVRYELKLYVSLASISEIKAFEERRKEAKTSNNSMI